MRAILLAAATVAACSAADSLPSEPPTLEITSPQRGASADSTQVTVTGTTTNARKVTVNGAEVSLGSDGSFQTMIDVGAGIGIIETHAIAGDRDVRDVRAVLAGPLAPTDGSLASPIGAHASATALRMVGNAIAADAQAIDYTAAVQPMNPVYDNGGCLGAKIDITSVTIGAIDVALVPHQTLATDVTIQNVNVQLHASFKVACIGGSTTITVTASAAHLHGDLGVDVMSGQLQTSIGNVSVQLDGFSMDVGSVPGAIESLFNSTVRGKVESALVNVISSKTPGMANKALAGLLAKPVNASILGHDATISIAPTAAAISDAGLFIAVATQMKVAGGEGGTALTMPMPMTQSLIDQTQGLGIAIADDAVNQLFGALWAAGSFDRQMDFASAGAIGALLDTSASTIELKLSLPPTVSTDASGLELAIGDLMLTTKDTAGAIVQQLAISVKTSLVAGPSQMGKLIVTVGAPEVHAHVVAQSDEVARPLQDTQLEAIVSGVWGVVGDAADKALEKLPMPEIAGVQLAAPAISGKSGYVVADIALQ